MIHHRPIYGNNDLFVFQARTLHPGPVLRPIACCNDCIAGAVARFGSVLHRASTPHGCFVCDPVESGTILPGPRAPPWRVCQCDVAWGRLCGVGGGHMSGQDIRLLLEARRPDVAERGSADRASACHEGFG
jgi:hypothetical protein